MAGANKAAAHGSNVEEDEDMREALKMDWNFASLLLVTDIDGGFSTVVLASMHMKKWPQE
jgi:hypothetical protein